jgi:O-antigen ligase
MGIHNFILEQYGEGGILTTLGVLGWLVLPIVHLRRSRLSPALAWAIVAAMAGLMVHGIFWSQFLNGLRFLTLVYVCLWTALATTGNRSQESE